MTPKNTGEKVVQRYMESLLDDTYIIIKNYKYNYLHKKRDVRIGEVDFIICHKNLGFIFIEVKGGFIKHDSGGFYRITKREKEYLKPDPFEQCVQHMFNVMDNLANVTNKQMRDNLSIPYTPIVIFPNCDFTSVSLKFRNRYIDAKNLAGNLETILKKIIRSFHSKDKLVKLDKRIFNEIVNNHLIGQVISKPNIRTILNTTNKEIIELTREQIEVLYNKRYNRAIIKGGPGTGKSILAAAKAKQLADEGYNVLLTCYNKALAKQLQKAVSGKKNIRVDAWCEYMCRQIKNIDPGYSKPDESNQELLTNFYLTELPAKFIECIKKEGPNSWRPNAIILDEGQDINSDLLLSLIEYMDNINTDPFVVFLDPNQNIFFRGEDAESEYRSYLSTEYTLPGTYRISKEIRNYIKDVVPNYIIPPSYIEYGETGEFFYTSGKEQGKQVSDMLEKLNNKSINYNEILIISYKHFEESVITEKINGKTIINGRNDSVLLEELSNNQILFYTVRSSKGLEAYAVLLVDLPTKSEIRYNDIFSQWFYIAASRAKHFLYCFYENE